jgi:hypothetical protein
MDGLSSARFTFLKTMTAQIFVKRTGPLAITPFRVGMSFLCLAVLFSGAPSLKAQSNWIGHSAESLEQTLGAPLTRAQMGAREIWTYAGGATVYLREGKIERIKGSLPYSPAVPTASQAAPHPASPTREESTSANPTTLSRPSVRSTPPEPFTVPRATIVTESGFQPAGTWGGESDGKTLGIDGRPLADHQIYANDCVYFERRMLLGLREAMGSEALQRVQDLRGILRLPNRAAQNAAAERYASRWRQAAGEDRLMPFAKAAERLRAAYSHYQEAIAQVNALEQVKAHERINLTATETSPEGAQWRTQAREAIKGLETARNVWMASDRRLYEIGAEVERRERVADAAH